LHKEERRRLSSEQEKQGQTDQDKIKLLLGVLYTKHIPSFL
jgi:hypothetical protein